MSRATDLAFSPRDEFVVQRGDVEVTTSLAEGVGRSQAGGLRRTFQRGGLNNSHFPARDLLEIGVRYQSCYEQTNGMLTPERHEVRGTSGRGGAQERRLIAADHLAVMRRNQTHKHIEAMDAVCGLDLTVNAAAERLKWAGVTVLRYLRDGLINAVYESRGG